MLTELYHGIQRESICAVLNNGRTIGGRMYHPIGRRDSTPEKRLLGIIRLRAMTETDNASQMNLAKAIHVCYIE